MPTNVNLARGIDVLDAYWDAATSVLLMLCDTSLWSATPTEEELFASEVASANGYARQNIAPTTPAAIANSRAERLLQAASISATGGAITYTGYAIVRNGVMGSNLSATAVNASNQITATAHGLANGDRVMVTADAGGAMPTGLDAGTFYYAQVVDANNITLFTEEALATQATFSDDGSGLRLRYAAGVAGEFLALGVTRTIDPAGAAHDITAKVFQA